MKLSTLIGLLAFVLAVVLITDPGLIAHTVHMAAAHPLHVAVAGVLPAGAEFGRKSGETATELPADATMEQVIARIKEIGGQVKNFAEDVKSKMTAGQTLSAELKEKSDKGLTELEELRQRLDEMEKKAARKGGEAVKAKSPGFTMIDSAEFKAAAANVNGFRGTVRAGVKTLGIKTVSSLAASAGVLVVPDIQDNIIAPGVRRLTIRDLLMNGRTSSNLIEFMKENVFTNNAAVVSETVQKPQSDITFVEDTAPVRTIAHWLLASKQILADAPRLQSYIDGRLLYGLKLKEEDEILNGSGAGQHLEGLVTQATAFSAPITISGATMIDNLRLAHLQAELAYFPSSGQVLHPSDWAHIELTKDDQGRYIFTNPVAQGGATLWGRPVVATQAMTVDKFLVGAFEMAAEVVDREDAAVEVSTEDGDNFKKNLVTIRCEERLALPVYRPAALIYGDFGNV